MHYRESARFLVGIDTLVGNRMGDVRRGTASQNIASTRSISQSVKA